MTRSALIQQSLERQGLDGLLLLVPENILFGSGFWPSTAAALFLQTSGPSTLIVPKPDQPLVPAGWKGQVLAYDTRLDDDPTDLFIGKLLRNAMGGDGSRRRRLGCDRSMETIAGTHIGGEARIPGEPFYKLLGSLVPGGDFVDVTPWIYEARMVKSPEEISAIKRCAEVVDKALDLARGKVSAGMRETELSGIIEGGVQTMGVGYKNARRARGFAFVMSGPENTAAAWAAYNISTDRKLAKGDLVLIELDSHVDGYWTDISRTFVVGRPSSKQREVWDAVRESQERTVESLRTGSRISKIDSTARDLLAARGYGANFLHHIGHGVGFAFHEMPYLDPAPHITTDWELQTGMVLAIEPGVYIEGWGGVRLEDNVVMTDNGKAEYLSKGDRAL